MEYYWFRVKELHGIIRAEERFETYIRGWVYVAEPYLYSTDGTIPYEVIEDEASEEEWNRLEEKCTLQ